MFLASARGALALHENYVCPRCAAVALTSPGRRRFQARRQLHVESSTAQYDAVTTIPTAQTRRTRAARRARSAAAAAQATDRSSGSNSLAATVSYRPPGIELVKRDFSPPPVVGQRSWFSGPNAASPPFAPTASWRSARTRPTHKPSHSRIEKHKSITSVFKAATTQSKASRPAQAAPVNQGQLMRRLDRARRSAMEAIRSLRESFGIEKERPKKEAPLPPPLKAPVPGPRISKHKKSGLQWGMLEKSSHMKLKPHHHEQSSPPRLSYGLDRVLFNPGVYRLQDPRSGVYNFDPYLEKIMSVDEFDYDALRKFVTSSEDETLTSIASKEKLRYSASTSSMTNMLAHFHYLLSSWRPPNMSMLSGDFPVEHKSFTILSKAPAAGMLVLKKSGLYALDADKSFSSSNILTALGRSMEKLLTLTKDEFEQYSKSHTHQGLQPPKEIESYHYTTFGDFVFRSQLDAYDPRLPGKGIFDVKTRAVVAIRMDSRNPHQGSGYEIMTNLGKWESFEREYHDLIRAAFLKYSLQVRMGRMDGIFVAYHNTERIFGFQYVPLSEMDFALHGQTDLTLGEAEFKYSIALLNKLLDKATERFPEQSLNVYCETRGTPESPFMYFIAKPCPEAQLDETQQKDEEDADSNEMQKEQDISMSDIDDMLNVKIPDVTRVAHALEEVQLGVKDDKAIIVGQDPLETTDLSLNDSELEAQATPDLSSSSDILEVDHGISLRSQVPEDLLTDEQSVEDDVTVDLAQQGELHAHETLETLEGAIDASMRGSNSVNGSDLKEEVDEDGMLDSEETRHTDSQPSSATSSTELPVNTSTADEDEVMVLKVRIKHWIGGTEVQGPPKNLTASSPVWQVQYSFEEPHPVAAQTIFRASNARRRQIFQRSAPWHTAYLSKLREMSVKGRKRRAQLDTERTESEKVVFSPSSPSSEQDGAWSQ